MNDTNQTNNQIPNQPYQPQQQPYQRPPYQPQQQAYQQPQQPYQQPVYQQPQQTYPQYQQPTATFERKVFQPEAPEKKSKLPLILGLVGGGVALVVAAVVILFLVFGGNKGEDKAEQVQTMIAALDEKITLESEAAILAAEEAYSALDIKDQIKVTNEKELEDARRAYDKIKKAYDAIEAIGTVEATDVCEDRIEDAWDAYNNLSEVLQREVTNYDKLPAAQSSYEQLQAEAVIRKIEAIGTVTVKSGDAIAEARDAYEELPAELKKSVTNFDKIEAAEKKLATLQKAEREQMLEQFSSSYSSADGITWYQPKAMPEFIDERSFIMPYLGRTDDTFWVRLVINYVGKEWIYFDEVTVVVDGEEYDDVLEDFPVERDSEGELAWETADFMAGNDDLILLKSIADSDTAVIRFEGEKESFDLTVSSIDKQAIRQVLEAYDVVK
ncbi:MAG: hypothetical protein IJN82_00575 [Clostridia bacterium]|nr:hypothetical protein [Clostridia bacterium]